MCTFAGKKTTVYESHNALTGEKQKINVLRTNNKGSRPWGGGEGEVGVEVGGQSTVKTGGKGLRGLAKDENCVRIRELGIFVRPPYQPPVLRLFENAG